jgi:hypothetical protein
METAKVDIRKLQLLNDRISQCFEALNQVRLSVHGVQGLSHTSAQDPRIAPFAPLQGQAFGVGYPQGINPYAASAPYIPGISHTTAASGMVPGLGAWDPRIAQSFQNPMAAPYGYPVQGLGLSHTTAETADPTGRLAWHDPILTARVVQTFPYATFAFLPASNI